MRSKNCTRYVESQKFIFALETKYNGYGAMAAERIVQSGPLFAPSGQAMMFALPLFALLKFKKYSGY